MPRFQADGDARDRATSLGASGRGEASFGFTPALWFIGYRKAAIKAEVTFAIARLKLAAGAIIFGLRPQHVSTRAVSERSAPRYPVAARRSLPGTTHWPECVLQGGFSRVAAMFWIYWDTFWSLFFSAVWFLTIVSHPDAEVAETYR